MKKHLLRSALILFVILITLLLFVGPLGRAYEALLFVGEMGGYSPPALLQTRSQVSVNNLCISNDSRHYTADLYLPEHSPEAGIVLLHGAAEAGKDDARLVTFAQQLAARRFAVLVPELPGPKALRIRAEDAQVAVDAFQFLNRYPGVEQRVGFGGISVSAGLAFLASLEPEIRNDVAFILSIGGYHNLLRTLDYSITGEYMLNGKRHRQTPNEYGKWVFVISNLDVLKYLTDRIALRQIAYRRMLSPDADISDMKALLSVEAQAVLDYVTENDIDKTAARYAALPAAMREHLEALDLSRRDLDPLKAKILLIHGYADPIIPYSESVSLARALPSEQVDLFLVHGLEHVTSRMQRLQDSWQFWRAGYALLTERDKLAEIAE